VWIIALVFSLCLGMLTGFYLPTWVGKWQKYRHRNTFKLKVLARYVPETHSSTQDKTKTTIIR